MAADSGQRTEQPTPRRLEKARREGNFPVSRELISAAHFLGVVAMAALFGGWFLLRLMRLTRGLLGLAFRHSLTEGDYILITRELIAPSFYAPAAAGLLLVVAVVTVQLASTRMGLSAKKLAPDIKRFNPLSKLKGLPGQNLPVFLQALVLLPLVAAVIYFELAENIDAFLELAWMAPQSAIARVGASVETLLWRASGLFLLAGLVDLVWQQRRYRKQLKMTKHEVREETKEQEGNPQIKMRVRRIQRDLARRQMMKEIPNATAVIVNPTHYAVAIRYRMPTASGEVASAPRVVAKGKNYLAARIRKKALEHEVPIVENPPLARALYASVEVGHEIPAHLYRAVAEILAYIYRMMGGRLPG